MLEMSFQYKIDKVIEAKKLTKTGVAKDIGVSRDTVYNLTESTAIGTYLKLCERLGISLSELIDNKKEIKKQSKKSTVVFELESTDVLRIDMKNKKLEIVKK